MLQVNIANICGLCCQLFASLQALQKLKNELRAKMEKEIRELQDMITRDDDNVYFRELEAERLQSQLQMASFQYSKTPSL